MSDKVNNYVCSPYGMMGSIKPDRVNVMFLIPDTTENFSHTGIAKVLSVITSEDTGRIRFQGTDWPARFKQPDPQMSATPRTKVEVVGRQGITLLVKPLGEGYNPLLSQKP